MILAAPWVLAALALLPVLWWLLRATPPAPRAQLFPAIRLLAGLRPQEETPARTPWWLLALRLSAAALVIVGLAGPVLTSGHVTLTGSGAALLVVDDGWASGPGFAERVAAADAVLDRLERARRPVSLLTTAAGPDGRPPQPTAAMPAGVLRPLLAALQPKPWPVDRAHAAAGVRGQGPVFYLTDGLATPSDPAFARALSARGAVTVFAADRTAPLLRTSTTSDRLEAVLRGVPTPAARTAFVLAETGDGRVLQRTELLIAANATEARAVVALPPELRNQLAALRLSQETGEGAGSVVLLDEAARRRPVGLVSGGIAADTPLLGDLFYLDRALAPNSELRRGDVPGLLARPLSMLIATAATLPANEAASIGAWVRHGGLLLRFASTALGDKGGGEAGDGDGLLPGRLLAGDRQMGGAMSWSQPARLAPFPDTSPFAGLAIPAEVTVNRQILADPSESGVRTWARLTDGTPLVTAARVGNGEIVLFHVTANADWSNLPLSGLFVDMLSRLVQRSAGVAASGEARALAPALSLDGSGVLGTPPPSARPVGAREIASALPSPVHPPGLYGPERDRHALNLGTAPIELAAMAPIPGATTVSLDATPRERAVGPWLIGLALGLLAADMVLTLALRGLLARRLAPGLATGLAALFLACPLAELHAQNPALATHLAYVATGDAEVDAVSRSGLLGLSDYVNGRTAAVLADPVSVVPGRDDLSFYPLLYLPVTQDAQTSPAAISALNAYMRAGGIVLIDLRGGGSAAEGSGAGMAPDTGAALRRIGQGLDIPRLAPLTSAHVLARSFYLLQDFPGRYDGDTVWVQRDQDRSNDSVSPVIVGSNDWAAAWAQDEDGRPLYATIPGGARQRTLAYRFGVNIVMYALTGNYKGDQVHVPAILERLGQ